MTTSEPLDRIERLADLLKLCARSVRWIARLWRTAAGAANLRTIADEIDMIATRLLQEGLAQAHEPRLH